MLSNTSSDFELIIRQQPDRARVAGGKEKGASHARGSAVRRTSRNGRVLTFAGIITERKPVDPPPIVQLRVREEGSYLAHLYDGNEDQPVPVPPSTALAGTLVSSLHRLKDVDNNDGGFFVFGDLSVKMEGQFRLKFTLFEMRKDVVTYLKSIISDRFTVSPSKTFPGMQESTFLSRSFADQGVKLRIRKEPRTLSLKRPPRPDEYAQPLPRSPDRSSMQMPGNAFSGYPAASRDYTYYGTPVKRQRTSVDYGNRGMYDAEGRIRQVDAYPQTATMYSNQPGTYQNPMMQGYPTGHAGVPDYAISYGIPSSAQVTQMQDPAAQSRSSQQATMQSLGMMNQPGTPTADSTGAMMSQGYPQSRSQQYQTSSTILPPLQRNRNYPQGTNGAATRGYFDQASQGATPILPSQPMGSNEGDRYGTAPGQGTFDHPGSHNGTPR
ncbi:protein vosA [Aspergillus clavatus NRRL 1]|uniref:Velvet domain-containing protein n=1 Tax=Aspergillus clavatus (strain ATCC 1007 / CBS 513.65 / DSM 816 / NCTC 3887 / NRRL 1 / QM 1276 / 107) TaxID=344612 RepID=A1CI26_ASPCL|nr:uncharacterized protein ACLA_050030 [Aspergillus clavatus NRRL 1]EAW10531.1 conserved hypothetical protein [Aspergillus clavatus NRRL 1]